jgi:UDP-3-O-[3-hydroxymyristoyl] N-acetylglucosamine deacetylase
MASTSFGGFAAAARQQPNAREISKSRRRTASASSGARRTRGASIIEGEYHRDHHHHHYHHHHQHQERIQRRGEVTTARATKAAVEDSLPSGFMNEAIRAEPKAYPPNRSYQQTVKKAFVVSGFGLHSGEDEIVRICPAYANEGRYFVRVSDDSIENETSDDELSDAQVNKLLLERARAMLSNDPSDRKEILKNQSILRSEDEEKIDSPGDFLGNQGSETRVQANLANLAKGLQISSVLNAPGTNDAAVTKPEHLLSALEALGVDNCRIEIGGTGELPILDGGAGHWAHEICKAGVTPASDVNDKNGEKVPKKQYKPREPVIVRDKDAFIMFTPQDQSKLSYGIDLTYKSTAIGKQWFSWTPLEDAKYDVDIAPARTFGTIQDYMAYYRHDIIKGGTASCSLIANGTEFLNPPMRNGWENECARHKVLDLIGDMSLLAEPGMAGVPIGHVLCHKASHELHAEFMRQLAATERDVVDTEVWVTEEQILKEEEEFRAIWD